jgi:hypothetical protein
VCGFLPPGLMPSEGKRTLHQGGKDEVRMFHARMAASRPARTLLALSISFATASVHAPASLGFVDDEAQDAPAPPYVIT